MENNSVTAWLDQLKNGQPEYAQPLWERFYSKMVRIAKARLGAIGRQVVDEEDVASIAFTEFCSGVDRGIFPKLDDRNDLWRILLRIVDRKAIDQIRYLTAEKRGGGRVQTESAIGRANGDQGNWGAGQIADAEPTPDFSAAVSDEVQRLLSLLDADERVIAIAKMQGHMNREISEQHGFSQRTVERKVALIKKIWLVEFNHGIS